MATCASVKTTLEIPDALFRKAKAAAAAQGQTLKQLMNEALRDKPPKPAEVSRPGWMKFFGVVREHSTELRWIDAVIEDEFERIDPAIWK